jgi:hypothetical protein
MRLSAFRFPFYLSLSFPPGQMFGPAGHMEVRLDRISR